MTYPRLPMVAMAAWLLASFVGCDDGAGTDGATGGSSGSDGANGALVTQRPGLWEGDSPGVEVCFFVSDDGRRLTAPTSPEPRPGDDPSSRRVRSVRASPECDLSDAGSAHSYDLRVDLAGTDETGQPCSFELSLAVDIPIDPVTGAFHVSGIQAPDGEAELSLSGQVREDWASGVARSERDGSSCRVGWAATRLAQCNDAAIDACFRLQQCCRSILVNPVFFQSCNAVVLQCNEAACRELFEGYVRCTARESELEPDVGSSVTQ